MSSTAEMVGIYWFDLTVDAQLLLSTARITAVISSSDGRTGNLPPLLPLPPTQLCIQPHTCIGLPRKSSIETSIYRFILMEIKSRLVWMLTPGFTAGKTIIGCYEVDWITEMKNFTQSTSSKQFSTWSILICTASRACCRDFEKPWWV